MQHERSAGGSACGPCASAGHVLCTRSLAGHRPHTPRCGPHAHLVNMLSMMGRHCSRRDTVSTGASLPNVRQGVNSVYISRDSTRRPAWSRMPCWLLVWCVRACAHTQHQRWRGYARTELLCFVGFGGSMRTHCALRAAAGATHCTAPLRSPHGSGARRRMTAGRSSAQAAWHTRPCPTTGSRPSADQLTRRCCCRDAMCCGSGCRSQLVW
jgi:hypothetical protein